jgi:hypothetical protein
MKESKFTKTPIIIGGCGRSGTTLLLSILSAHQHIFGIPFETNTFCASSIDLKGINDYFLTQDIPDGSRWCEKTPRNILFVDGILKYFNNDVRILNIVRDGRDVILSRHPENPDQFWIDPERWIKDVKAGIEVENKNQVMTLKYEDLVLDFGSTVQKILAFIDEEYNPEISNWHQHTKVKVHEAWFEKVQPLYKDSIGKWKSLRYRQRVKGFMNKPEAVALLKYYNYID